MIRSIVGSGVSLPWNLVLAALIGLALLFTRVLLGVDGTLANVHHVIGSLVLTVVAIAAAEVARPARYFNALLGAVLAAVPFMMAAALATSAFSLVLGVALVVLSIRRGAIRERYGSWQRLIV